MGASWLPIFWASLIAFAMLFYVIIDGYDLGVGILSGTTQDEDFHDTMMSAIAPFWNGNEVWLVLIGAGLFAAFPMVYAIFLPAFYLPMVLGGVAISLLWLWLFSPSQGLINIGLGKVFDFFGQDSLLSHVLAWPLQFLFGKANADSLLPGWISSERGALSSLILMSCWTLGGSMIINLAGLQAIPMVYYEAAEIDGADRWGQFWRITIPLLSPTIFFNLVMGVIGSFQVFTQGLIMTNGGPNNSTYFYVLYTYRNAFEFFKMGYASALAWVLFMIILALTLLVVRSSSWWVFYEAQKR